MSGVASAPMTVRLVLRPWTALKMRSSKHARLSFQGATDRAFLLKLAPPGFSQRRYRLCFRLGTLVGDEPDEIGDNAQVAKDLLCRSRACVVLVSH